MNFQRRALAGVVLAFSLLGLASIVWARTASPPTLGGCPIYPADNIWNTPVDTLPVDPSSAAYINTIGPKTHPHADFGSGVWPPGSDSPIGIPYVVVPTTQAMASIDFSNGYPDESDPGPYPVPTHAPIEGGPSSDGDRHVLVVRQGECKLYELYRAFPNANGSWDADSGAVYTLTVNGPLREAGWTSADAAGLPILPGLARYEEVAAGEINHALRFTVAQTRRAYVWPARHFASSSTDPNDPPMGQRFRLKASFVIDNSFSPQGQVILRALKKYGMIIADNGSNWYISGAPNAGWDNDALADDFARVSGSDFEAVDVSGLMVNVNSGQVIHSFTLGANPSARAIAPGGVAAYRLDLAAFGFFTDTVIVTAANPSPSLTLGLAPTLISLPGAVTLTMTDTHIGPLAPGLWYSVPVTASGGSVVKTATLGLLVGGTRTYLPVILKNSP
jgi:hypothetical protein